MIRGYCRTNLDDFKREKWPEMFVAVPRVGEYVRSEDGKELRVIRVIHQQAALEPYPKIEVELHK